MTDNVGLQINQSPMHYPAHIDEDDLEQPFHHCRICSSTAIKRVARVQTSPDIFLMECGTCHAASVSQLPTMKRLRDYYQQDYYSKPKSISSEANVTFHGIDRMARHLVKQFPPLQHNGHISLLDYGGGDGSIAVATSRLLLKENSVEHIKAVVFDYTEKLIDSSDERIELRKCASERDLGTHYDIVIASAILEHVPNPLATLNRLLKSIRPGGIFYARTPYVVPLIKLLRPLGISWQFGYPAHLHDLGQRFWEHQFNDPKTSSQFTLLKSQPSVVETTFNERFFRTLAAHALKAPWHLLGRRYGLVGGWEIFAQKTAPE